MGNNSESMEQTYLPKFSDSVKYIMFHQGLTFNREGLEKPLKVIMTHIRKNHPFSHENDILQIDDELIRLFYSPYFSKQLLKTLKHLIEILQQINHKSIMMITLTEIEYMTNLANFLIFASNDNIITIFQSLMVRSDIHEASRKVLREIQEKEDEIQFCYNIVKRLAKDEVRTVQKFLRVTLSKFINSRQETLGRSEATLKHLVLLEQSLFMLYTKVYFAEPVGNRQKQNFKKNLIIGAYFLSLGNNYIKSSIFETAVLFIYSLISTLNFEQLNKYSAIKTLPSHYFRKLPVVPSNSLYDYIICNAFYALKYIKEGQITYSRFVFNRIQALKMVEKLIVGARIQNEMITYYLEKLCLQVKSAQIQRAFILRIVKGYNKNLESQSKPSIIFQNFLKTSDLKYNLKFSGKELKISSDELLTELEDDEGLYSKQYALCNETYLYDSIFFQQLHKNKNDRKIWNQIMPGIIQNIQDKQIYKQKHSVKQESKERLNSTPKNQIQQQLPAQNQTEERQDQQRDPQIPKTQETLNL